LKEGLASIIEAKLIGIESFFHDRFLKHYFTAARALWRQATISYAPNMFFEILAVGSLIGTITFLSNQKIDLMSVMPVVGLYSFAFIRLIPSVTAIIRSIQGIKFSTPALEVVHADFKKLAYTPTEIQNSQHNNQHIKFKNISLQNISLAYTEDKNVIDGLSMEINKGEAIGITGPSGSGKTTLINLILGLFKPDSGLIYVNDEEIHTNLGNWRSLIGYVPQSITLVDASIRENVALGLEGSLIDNHKVWSVLKEANLEKFVHELPQQLDTFIGENGMRISGGQRQRLGLARALYRNPEVIVFDEATSALDVETEKRITEEIMKLSGKRTLIIVAHRTSTIKDCDVIYYIKDGKILNSGRYDELKELNT
jgi:ABC-type multidrug transport system fused ATPase/permease subunit